MIPKNNSTIMQLLARTSKMMMSAIAFLFITTVSLEFGDNEVIAASSTSNMSVSASVSANCTFSQVVPLAFGEYNGSANTPLEAASTFKISCTKNATATIQLNNGLYSSFASGTTRAIRNVTFNDYLSYELYKDSGRTTVWNNTNVVTYTATTSSPATFSVYGRMPTHQMTQPGTYQDTVTLTATF
jgi:spore coat protein U-like protein